MIELLIDVFFVSDSVPDWYKTQEICYSLVSENNFLIVYCPDKYKTYRMCDEAVDDCLAAFKFIPDWLITSKMLEKFDNAHALMMIYSFIMKTLIMSHLLLIKDIFFL